MMLECVCSIDTKPPGKVRGEPRPELPRRRRSAAEGARSDAARPPPRHRGRVGAEHLSAKGGRGGDELDSLVSEYIREFRDADAGAEENALAEADSGNESEMTSSATKDRIQLSSLVAVSNMPETVASSCKILSV